MYFPGWFSGADLNYLDQLKKYLELRIKYEEDYDVALIPEMNAIRDILISHTKPKVFDPEDRNNEIVKLENDFEAMCSALEECGITSPKSMTVFEFYSRIRHFEKKNKPKANGNQ